jgi:hypothetical protein
VALNGTPVEAKIRTFKYLKGVYWLQQVRPTTVQMTNFSLIETKRIAVYFFFVTVTVIYWMKRSIKLVPYWTEHFYIYK